MEESLRDKKNMRIKEIMSLNLLCQMFNSKEFKDLFGKCQMYYVPNPKVPEDVEKGMDLVEMIELAKQKNKYVKTKEKLARKENRRLKAEDLDQAKTIQELVSYFLTDLNQNTLEDLSAEYLNSMYKNEKLTNRGMHSMTTGIVNALLAKKAFLKKPDIVLAFLMGFVHDIGHTPFGHDMERLIDVLVKKETNMDFSHEQNGLIKFNKLARRIEEKYYEDLTMAIDREGLTDYDETAISNEYSVMLGKVKNSILVHSIKRMPKVKFETMKRYQFVNKYQLGLSRTSDKIAYTVSDSLDAQRGGLVTKEELRRNSKRHTNALVKEYAQRHNIDLDIGEITDMFDEFSDLSLGEQAMYLVRQTNRTEDGLYMNPLVWRISKAYRKSVAESRKEAESGRLNKDLKAVYASGYIVWESIFLRNYKMEKDFNEDIGKEELSEVVDRTNTMVCQFTDKEMIEYASKILSEIRTNDEDDATRNVQDSLEERYLSDR